MLKTSGGSLLEALRRLGAVITRRDAARVAEEKLRTDETTADIVVRLALAPPYLVEQALELAAGSADSLEQTFSRATASCQAAGDAAKRLSFAANEFTRVASAGYKK